MLLNCMPLVPHETEHGDQLLASHLNVELITGHVRAKHGCCVLKETWRPQRPSETGVPWAWTWPFTTTN